jgi:hypothetical protein
LPSPGRWQQYGDAGALLSFEKRYTLNIVVTDFTDDIDLLFVPIMAWLRVNQPDIMTTDEGEKRICLVR